MLEKMNELAIGQPDFRREMLQFRLAKIHENVYIQHKINNFGSAVKAPLRRLARRVDERCRLIDDD